MRDPRKSDSEYSWKRDPLFWAYSVLMSLPLILVFFFYNHYRLDFLVYSGWLLIGFGLILIFLAGAEFRRHGGSPPGESIVKTTNLVDSGIYGVVRNPQ